MEVELLNIRSPGQFHTLACTRMRAHSFTIGRMMECVVSDRGGNQSEWKWRDVGEGGICLENASEDCLHADIPSLTLLSLTTLWTDHFRVVPIWLEGHLCQSERGTASAVSCACILLLNTNNKFHTSIHTQIYRDCGSMSVFWIYRV